MESVEAGSIAAICGFAGGLVLGFCARWGRFCTLSSIESAVLGGNLDGLRMWGLAISVAIVGSYGLDQAGLVDISQSFYLAAPPVIAASIAGGLLFGLGMAFVGTCGFGTLARIGGGDLKSVVTFLVMGISAYATIRGVFAYIRVSLFPSQPNPDQSASIAGFLEESVGFSIHFWAYTLALLLAVVCLSSNDFVRNRKKLLVGLLVGLTIVWGWVATGIVAQDAFEPVPLESYTFSAPLGETIMYVMTMSGASLKFGIGAVLGVIAGAWLTSLLQGHFRWEACDDARELRRQIFGGILMGVGSVTALGCTIGQGLSAASLLASSAPVALISMFIGAWIGLHYLVGGSFLEPVRALFTSK